ADLPAGVELRALTDALVEDESLLNEHLAQHALFEQHAFAALNTALFEGGMLIQVKPGVVLERPLVLAYLTSAEAAQRAVYPRTLIVAEEGAQLQVAEFHRGGTAEYLYCPVTEIVVGANAAVHHHSIQEIDRD